MLTSAPLGTSVPAGRSSNAVFLPLMVTLISTAVIHFAISILAALSIFWFELLLSDPSVPASAASCVAILLFAVFFFAAVVDSAFFSRVAASSFFVSASVAASCVVVSSFLAVVSCSAFEAVVLFSVVSVVVSSVVAFTASLLSFADCIDATFSANTPGTFDVPVEVQSIANTRVKAKNTFPARFIANLPSSLECVPVFYILLLL